MEQMQLTMRSVPLKSYGKRPRKLFVSLFIMTVFTIIFGIIWLFIAIKIEAPIFFLLFGILFIILAIKNLVSPSKYYLLNKNGKRIKNGMHIDEVREILGIFKIEKEGYNGSNQYCVYFKEKAMFGKDYEGVFITFSNNYVSNVDFSYHRTTTTTHYY